MADRYQDRPFPADDGYDRGGEPHAPARAENDPLAELARLIGQSDPFAMGRANQPVQPRSEREPYQPPAPADDDEPAAGPPPWMRRATPQAAPVAPQEDYEQDYPSAVHPLHRYAAPLAAPEPEFHQAPSYAADAGQEPDPSRYDDALYGQLDPGAPQTQYDPAYADDPYAYQDGYGDDAEEPVSKRRGGMVTVAVVLALAVVGTGAAFAYRTYLGSPRSGEPPIIKADNSPTKIVPAPSDGSAKVPDRMATGDGKEKIVPREEAPVDVNARTGPRVVFPPLNPNSNPPSAASVAPVGPLPAAVAGNGTLPSSGTEPRRIKTLAVRGDQADGAVVPVNAPPPAKPAPAPKAAPAAAAPAAPVTRGPPSSANASANAPLSLAPQPGQPAAAAEPRARVAAVNPAPSSGGGYMVQVASQKNEADAHASYRTLQGKYSSVLGSRSPVIRRADLGDKGVYYRAMIGPFGSAEEASQFCSTLKTAGGQCVIQRN